jgi:hypothetical protein
MLIMHAITIRDPWCQLILDGLKLWEYRKWKPHVVPPLELLLCKAKRWDRAMWENLCRHGYHLGQAPEYLGHAVGVCTFMGSMPAHKSPPMVPGRPLDGGGVAWRLGNVRQLVRPFPVRGQLGLYTVECEQEDLQCIE